MLCFFSYILSFENLEGIEEIQDNINSQYNFNTKSFSQKESQFKKKTEYSTIDVMGYGNKIVQAKIIKILFLFSSYSKSASYAYLENKKNVERFLTEIDKLEIENILIKTISYDMVPKHSIRMNDDCSDLVEGYTISQELIITLESKTLTAKIIDLADESYGVLKSVDWETPEDTGKSLRSELIKKAVQDSWVKASQSAIKLGYEITSVKSMKLLDKNMNAKEKYNSGTFSIYETYSLSIAVTYNIEKTIKGDDQKY